MDLINWQVSVLCSVIYHYGFYTFIMINVSMYSLVTGVIYSLNKAFEVWQEKGSVKPVKT